MCWVQLMSILIKIKLIESNLGVEIGSSKIIFTCSQLVF